MSAASGITTLIGHAKKACVEEAGCDHGDVYAAALCAQASALRTVADHLETEALKAKLGEKHG